MLIPAPSLKAASEAGDMGEAPGAFYCAKLPTNPDPQLISEDFAPSLVAKLQFPLVGFVKYLGRPGRL